MTDRESNLGWIEVASTGAAAGDHYLDVKSIIAIPDRHGLLEPSRDRDASAARCAAALPSWPAARRCLHSGTCRRSTAHAALSLIDALRVFDVTTCFDCTPLGAASSEPWCQIAG